MLPVCLGISAAAVRKSGGAAALCHAHHHLLRRWRLMMVWMVVMWAAELVVSALILDDVVVLLRLIADAADLNEIAALVHVDGAGARITVAVGGDDIAAADATADELLFAGVELLSAAAADVVHFDVLLVVLN